MVAAGVQHKRAALVTREVLSMFEELGREGPHPGELEKARRRLSWDARSMSDSAEEASAFFAGGLLFKRFATPEEHVAELLRVSAEEVLDDRLRTGGRRPKRLEMSWRSAGLLE